MNPSISQPKDDIAGGPAARADRREGAGQWTSCLEDAPPREQARDEILIGVLPGEGIGPEVIRCALHVLNAVTEVTGLRVNAPECGPIGRDAERACGTPLPGEVVRFCQEVFSAGGAVLNGPGGGRYVYQLRKELDLFFKISPLRVVDGVADASRLQPRSLREVDILVTRENTAGIYQGTDTDREVPDAGRVAEHSFSYSAVQVRRFLEASARLAQQRHGNLAVVWKESGVPSVSALWRDQAEEVAEACGVEWSMVDVDLMAYRLIQDASMFDVVAAPNLFGDVLADLGAVLLGSRGVSYSGNFDACGRGVYQTNHGAAYHLAGLDEANPAGQILSMAMMLRESFGLHREAGAIVKALRSVWRAGWRTADVSPPGIRPIGTREFVARVGDSAAAIVGGCETAEPEVG